MQLIVLTNSIPDCSVLQKKNGGHGGMKENKGKEKSELKRFTFNKTLFLLFISMFIFTFISIVYLIKKGTELLE